MQTKARHFCRNTRCRTKLSEPVDNHHHAFCVRGCYSSFYRSHCIVCEKSYRRRSERRETCGRSKCKGELRTFPHVYRFPANIRLLSPQGAAIDHPAAFAPNTLRNAHSAGLKTPLADARPGVTGSPPKSPCLRHWLWEEDLGEHRLFNQDLNMVARINERGRIVLTWLRVIPKPSWSNLENAKRGAESIALASLPPDEKTQRALDRDNERACLPIPVRQHEPRWEMTRWSKGWRPWSPTERSLSGGKGGDPGRIPEFLMRT